MFGELRKTCKIQSAEKKKNNREESREDTERWRLSLHLRRGELCLSLYTASSLETTVRSSLLSQNPSVFFVAVDCNLFSFFSNHTISPPPLRKTLRITSFSSSSPPNLAVTVSSCHHEQQNDGKKVSKSAPQTSRR